MWPALTQLLRLSVRHTLMVAALLAPALAAVSLLAGDGSEVTTPEGFRGSYFVDGQIHVNVYGTSEGKALTTGQWDFKPS